MEAPIGVQQIVISERITIIITIPSRNGRQVRSAHIDRSLVRSHEGSSSISGNHHIFVPLGNSMSSSTSLYQPSHQASMYNPNGIAQQGSYAPSTYSAHLSSTGNIYGTGYTSSSAAAAAAAAMIPSNEIPSSSSPASWNQYAAANNLANGATAAAYDPNMYFAPYYANLFAQQYYPQQQTMSQSQAPGPIDQTISPGGLVTSSNGTGSAPTGAAAVIPANGGGSAVSSGGGVGTEKNYPHLSR